MAKGGAQPGAGRPKGRLSRSTIERAIVAERIVNETAMSGKKLAKEYLDEFMGLFATIAAYHQPRPETIAAWSAGDPALPAKRDLFERFSTLALNAAKELAKYQSPTFKAIEVSAPAPTMQGEDGKKVTRFTLHIFGDDPRMKTIEAKPAKQG